VERNSVVDIELRKYKMETNIVETSKMVKAAVRKIIINSVIGVFVVPGFGRMGVS
jgi:hypothetical protein